MPAAIEPIPPKLDGARPVTSSKASDPRPAVDAIVRRLGTLRPADRRRLGRWTSASLRDPRLARHLEAARERALATLESQPELRRRWESASRPLYEGLVASAAEDRRWRIVMLASHFAALLAIVNVPAGLSPLIALVITLAAPASAWAAWGRGTAWLGAINAALAAALPDQLEPAEIELLKSAWANAIEAEPPASPPVLGAIGAFAPSALLVVALIAVALTMTPR
jgi:hypothetical protein